MRSCLLAHGRSRREGVGVEVCLVGSPGGVAHVIFFSEGNRGINGWLACLKPALLAMDSHVLRPGGGQAHPMSPASHFMGKQMT